jgi:hypothetical protein
VKAILRFLTEWICETDVEEFDLESCLASANVGSIAEHNDELSFCFSSSFSQHHKIVRSEVSVDEWVINVVFLQMLGFYFG